MRTGTGYFKRNIAVTPQKENNRKLLNLKSSPIPPVDRLVRLDLMRDLKTMRRMRNKKGIGASKSLKGDR